MPQIKWGAPKFWYEVGWRQYSMNNTSDVFAIERVYPPQRQFVVPSVVLNAQYQFYVRAVNQQPGGEFKRTEKNQIRSFFFHLETNSTYASETPIYHLAFAGDAGNDSKISSMK